MKKSNNLINNGNLNNSTKKKNFIHRNNSNINSSKINNFYLKYNKIITMFKRFNNKS